MAARDTTVGSTPIGSAMPLGSGRKSSGWGIVRRHDRQGPQRGTGGWRLANLNDVVAVKHQRSAIGSQQVRFSEGLWSFLNHPIRFSLVRWGLEKGCSGPEDRVRASSAPADAYLIPFSLMWGGFAIFWEYSVLSSKGPFFFEIWGIPFVLIGLYLIVGRFFADARQRAKTYYGLTNQRVIIVSGLLAQAVKSLQLRTLSDVSLSERSDGTGTITFGPTAPWWSGASSWPGSGPHRPRRSIRSPGRTSVFERVRTAQREA